MSLRTQNLARYTLGPLTGAVSRHWWRGYPEDPQGSPNAVCAFRACGEPRYRHWQECGEWTMPARERWARIWRRLVRRITKGGTSQ